MNTEQAQLLFVKTFPLLPTFEEEWQPFLGLQLFELGACIGDVLETGKEGLYSLQEISSFIHLLLEEGDECVADRIYGILLVDQMYEEEYVRAIRSVYERDDVSKNLKEYITDMKIDFDYDLHIKKCGNIIGNNIKK